MLDKKGKGKRVRRPTEQMFVQQLVNAKVLSIRASKAGGDLGFSEAFNRHVGDFSKKHADSNITVDMWRKCAVGYDPTLNSLDDGHIEKLRVMFEVLQVKPALS